MTDVTLALPHWDHSSSVEIEVSVSGRSSKETYRVITVPCQTDPGVPCASTLRKAVLTVEPGWQLVSIGTPGAEGIPLLFRHRESPAE